MTALDSRTVEFTGPGAYDLPEDLYHADTLVPGGSLSYSGAKRMLPPSCPALYRHEQLHGRPDKPAYDFGHAVHSIALGSGAPIVPVDAADWRTKAAKDARDAAYASGHVPLLVADHDAAHQAAQALLDHPVAGALLGRDGIAEQSLFWQTDLDDGTDRTAWRRARPDWQTTLDDGRPILVDVKTCVSASPTAIAKAAWAYRYDMQHAGYTDGAQAAHGYDIPPAFLFAFVEKTAPYLVTVCELDADGVAVGRASNLRALRLWADCRDTGTWPGYTNDIPVITLPPWAQEASA